tara:strand:- start:34691 stop:36091 length:1401 start_codon:yes stop_codon:yes gene_type:complete
MEPKSEIIVAEQQLLGAIITNNQSLDMVGDFLAAEHFADPVHADIFRKLQGRIGKGHGAGVTAMRLAMEGHEGLNELGGARYLVRLAASSVAGHAVRDYAAMVVQDAARRTLSQLAQDAQSGLVEGNEPHEVASRLLHGIQSLPEAVGQESSVSLMSAVTDAIREAVDMHAGKISFLKTGIRALDDVIKGLAPGDYCLLGGATSAGKTSVALEITKNVAFRGGQGVAFVSLEMSERELATRISSSFSRVPYASLRDAEGMSDQDFEKWISGAQQAAMGAMRIIPKHVRDIPAIHAACKRAARELGDGAPLSLVVIDYVQLCRGQGKDTVSQMREVSIQTKHMARMLGVPVIALVQLSRSIGHREEKRPFLSDIKETGQFENDADQAIFVHREHYWLNHQGPDLDPKTGRITEDAQRDWAADLAATENKIELIVRKNRHGRLATAEVGCHMPTGRFWDLKNQEEMPL